MQNMSAFYCFTHIHSSDRVDYRYAIAFKPPGPIDRSVFDDLMVAMCKGPQLPDAVLIVSIANDESADTLSLLRSETSKVAQQRLYSRIPLLHASYELTTGKCDVTLLDESFRARHATLQKVCQNAKAWIQSGLRVLFDPERVILNAPSGYAYEKPSGGRAKIFLKPDLAFTTSAAIAFVSFAIFHRLFAAKQEAFVDLRTVFVDTMAISPVAYGLRELLAIAGSRKPFHIESFHSYGGFEEVCLPLPGTSLCLISASTSMDLHGKWIAEKQVAHHEVVTLLTLQSARHRAGALVAINSPHGSPAKGPAQLSIRIRGESFLPEQEPAKRVLLNEVHHSCDGDVRYFCDFAGRQVFDVFRRPPKSRSKVRALYVDGDVLLQQPEFNDWLENRLFQTVKAAARVIVHQGDSASHDLAVRVGAYCRNWVNEEVPIYSAENLPAALLPHASGVIICSAVIGKGSQLLEISRALRDLHQGPRLYVIGFHVAETSGELRSLLANLRHSKGDIPHEIIRYGAAAIGTQLLRSYDEEVKTYYDSSVDLGGIPKGLRARAEKLGGTTRVGELALLPHGTAVNGEMRLRHGFAYWSKFPSIPCQPAVIATIAILLQRAREYEKLPEEKRLASASYRHVILDPENFARFNDGVIQAAILRSAYPSELDYRSDHAASDFMKAVIVRALHRASQEAGEASLEFMAALATGRMQLSSQHLDEVTAVAKTITGGSPALRNAIRFIFKPSEKPKHKLPF